MLLPRIAMLSLAMMVLGTAAALGQTYPNKTVRIVTTETGGSSDFASRDAFNGLLDAITSFREIHYGWAQQCITKSMTRAGLAARCTCSGFGS